VQGEVDALDDVDPGFVGIALDLQALDLEQDVFA
jgi:hypothetical protein